MSYRGSEKDKARRRAWYAANRERVLEEKRIHRLANLDAHRARDRRYGATSGLMHKHGMTNDELGALYVAQQGLCGICGVGAPARGPHCLHIDHDHATGERRGLLCFNCNRALDVMEKAGPTWALRALTYLSDPPLRRMRTRRDRTA